MPKMTKDVFIDHVKNELAANNTRQAIDLLQLALKDRHDQYYNMLLLQFSRWNDLQHKVISQTILPEHIVVERNQINEALFYILDDLNALLPDFEIDVPVATAQPSAKQAIVHKDPVQEVVQNNKQTELPGEMIGLNDAFYVVREGEEHFISHILDSGALLRIKGPRQFGLKSLLSRVVRLAESSGYQLISFNFQQISINNLRKLDNLLLQLMTLSSKALNLPSRVKQYWEDPYLDSIMKCSDYFEEYLLAKSSAPVVLALSGADRLFDHEEVSDDFFGMLRFWHERAKSIPIWQNLRQVISYSTDALLAINNLNQSPFNVGIEFTLNEFNREEIVGFAQMYDLDIDDKGINRLMRMIGGHPFLVHTAFHLISKGDYSLESLLQDAPKYDGPFGKHLQMQLENLNKNPEQAAVMKEIVERNYANDPIKCNKLKAAGLIKGTLPEVKARCHLYKIFFKDRL